MEAFYNPYSGNSDLKNAFVFILIPSPDTAFTTTATSTFTFYLFILILFAIRLLEETKAFTFYSIYINTFE